MYASLGGASTARAAARPALPPDLSLLAINPAFFKNYINIICDIK
jgi:hypothetical protein